MSERLPAGLVVGALLRRVHNAGGSAMVLAKGDVTGGAILVLTLDRGQRPRFFERGITAEGTMGLIESGPRDDSPESIADYWRRRVGRDPDLWVIELDIPEAERFVAETIATV